MVLLEKGIVGEEVGVNFRLALPLITEAVDVRVAQNFDDRIFPLCVEVEAAFRSGLYVPECDPGRGQGRLSRLSSRW
jgi:hypothetical protein